MKYIKCEKKGSFSKFTPKAVFPDKLKRDMLRGENHTSTDHGFDRFCHLEDHDYVVPMETCIISIGIPGS